MGLSNYSWTFVNKRYYKWTLVFKFVLVFGLIIFMSFELVKGLIIVIPRNFSHSYDITLILMMIFPMLFILLVYRWVWVMRYHILNPSFRMNEEMMEIDRKKKVRFYWKDVKEVIVTDKVEFIGMLYNIERNAIIFKLKNGKQEFLIIDKGIYINEFERFFKLMKDYIGEEKLNYKNDGKYNRLREFKEWNNGR